MNRRALAVPLLLALAACGAGAKATAQSSALDPARLLAASGCASSPSPDGPGLFLRESVSCTNASGDDLEAVTFSTTTNRDQWLRAAQAFGGVYVVGPLWAVSVETQGEAEAVQRANGGDIK